MTETRNIAIRDAGPEEFEIDDALPMEPARAAQLLLYLIAGLVLLTLVWASVARLDRVTRGQGWVVTSNQLQEVQYLEGGIVKEILVQPGETVGAGDVLVKLDPTQMNVEFLQGREEFNLLAARIARLEAEAALQPLELPAALASGAPDIAAREKALYDARMAELEAAIALENNKVNQRLEAHADAKIALATAKEAFAFADQELSMVSKLVDKGIEPRVEKLRAQQREATARGEMQRAKIAVSQTALQAEEAKGEIKQVRKTFAAAAADELNAAKASLAELKGALPALEDKVTRTDVRAPVAGVVNRVLVTTIGGVVAPGETIVEIVPTEDTLVVEAKIRPADIGFLSIGQEAKVSITAFDSSVYGSLEGSIETISPDAIEDEKSGERFYNIRVRTGAAPITAQGQELKILPGMAADVSILNGKRSVLAYILKPLNKVGDRALTEQ
ncbi:MAG: HlyD family type I secretion periplasmic adaptor subunit [Pseudomonadota bacterium]